MKTHTRYFKYPRRVAYHETDAMGVLHHANHVKYFEEARVEWLRARDLIAHHEPYGPYIFAVTYQDTKYFKPAGFDDSLEVWVQTKLEGAKIFFQYALWSHKLNSFIAAGSTKLVAISREDFKPTKLPPALIAAYKNEPWDETWPPAN